MQIKGKNYIRCLPVWFNFTKALEWHMLTLDTKNTHFKHEILVYIWKINAITSCIFNK